MSFRDIDVIKALKILVNVCEDDIATSKRIANLHPAHDAATAVFNIDNKKEAVYIVSKWLDAVECPDKTDNSCENTMPEKPGVYFGKIYKNFAFNLVIVVEGEAPMLRIAAAFDTRQLRMCTEDELGHIRSRCIWGHKMDTPTITAKQHPADTPLPVINQLTPAQLERIAILFEECGEVVQMAGKIVRHGYNSYYPGAPEIANKVHLEKEIGHVVNALSMLVDAGDVDLDATSKAAELKKEKIKKYTHYQND